MLFGFIKKNFVGLLTFFTIGSVVYSLGFTFERTYIMYILKQLPLLSYTTTS